MSKFRVKSPLNIRERHCNDPHTIAVIVSPMRTNTAPRNVDAGAAGLLASALPAMPGRAEARSGRGGCMHKPQEH